MEPDGSRSVTVIDAGWRRAVRHPERLVLRVLQGLGARADVILASDRVVRRLNAAHRGRDTVTNVLSFPPARPGLPGEIVLALGTVRREAEAAGRSVARHLMHLVAHGALHLRGLDHHGAGEARAMEMAEARVLARLGVANPWRPR